VLIHKPSQCAGIIDENARLIEKFAILAQWVNVNTLSMVPRLLSKACGQRPASGLLLNQGSTRWPRLCDTYKGSGLVADTTFSEADYTGEI
jgi:hypothetical protein